MIFASLDDCLYGNYFLISEMIIIKVMTITIMKIITPNIIESSAVANSSHMVPHSVLRTIL